jgi:hypothetical protein
VNKSITASLIKLGNDVQPEVNLTCFSSFFCFAMLHSKTILLLKEKLIQTDSNVDIYEQKFRELGNYKILYLPLLEHSLVNINELINILNEANNKYRGVIVTSQRAVEGLKMAWEQAFFSTGKYNEKFRLICF